MRLKVISYVPWPCDYHVCKDERGDEMKVDLRISGSFVDETDPESMNGKTVDVEWTSAYVSIAHGVKLADESHPLQDEMNDRARRLVEEQPRHSDVSLREQLWAEFPDEPDEAIEEAVRCAL